MGFPTMLLRPTTTAFAPSSFAPASGEQAHAARGVHGDERTATARGEQSPALTGWKPSTSLAGSMQVEHALARRCRFGSGSWTRMPSTVGSALSAATQRDELGLATSRRQPWSLPAHADLVRGLLLVARVDDARRVFADEHDVEPGRPAVLGPERVDARPEPRRGPSRPAPSRRGCAPSCGRRAYARARRGPRASASAPDVDGAATHDERDADRAARSRGREAAAVVAAQELEHEARDRIEREERGEHLPVVALARVHPERQTAAIASDAADS